jgi:transcriptional regulator with XRE-family HTH domain
MLNEALRLLRVFHDKKSIDLAKDLGISASYLSEIENGKKEPNLELVRKYAKEFNTTPSALLFFSESLPTNKKSSGFKNSIMKSTIKFLQSIEDAGKKSISN